MEHPTATSANHQPNTLFIVVSEAGLPEVNGLYVPSTAPTALSESGISSSPGYWNDRRAWDRADGECARSPSLSYSNTYRSWRISRGDGHLAYHIVCEDELPPVDREWEVYKKGVAPSPKFAIFPCDPRLPCPAPNVVFVLGGPGAGKGTVCELAEHQLGWVHLSTGNLLRAEMQAGGHAAGVIEEHVNSGTLVPNGIVVTLLKREMERITRTTGQRNFLIDGFPRSLSNLDAWEETFDRPLELPLMLFLECPYNILETRILRRAKYTSRADDNIESLKLRFHTFKAQTLPTVQHFQARGRCVRIDTSQPRQAMYDVVRHHLAEHTDPALAARPLTEQAEILLGLRPWPRPASLSPAFGHPATFSQDAAT